MGRRLSFLTGLGCALLASAAGATTTKIYLRNIGGTLSTSIYAPTESSNAGCTGGGCVVIPVCAGCPSNCPALPQGTQSTPPASPVTFTFVLSELWGRDPSGTEAFFRYAARAANSPDIGFTRPKMQIRYLINDGFNTVITERFGPPCTDCLATGCPLNDTDLITFDKSVGGNISKSDEVLSATLPATLPAGSTVLVEVWSADGEDSAHVVSDAVNPSYIDIPYAKDNYQIRGAISPRFITAGTSTVFTYTLDNTDISGPDISKLEIKIPGAVSGTQFYSLVSVVSVSVPGSTSTVTQATTLAQGTLSVTFGTVVAKGQVVTIVFNATTPVSPVQSVQWKADAFAPTPIAVLALSTDSLYHAVLNPPATPTTVAAVAQNTAGTGGQLAVTWNHPGPAVSTAITMYFVYRGSSAATATTFIASVPPSGVAGTGPPGWLPSLTIVTQTTGLRLDDTGLPNSETICYAIKAVNPVGESVLSVAGCGIPYAEPRQVTSLTALTRDGAVELSWDPAVAGTYGIAAYEIRRATCAVCVFSSSVFVAGATASVWIDTPVANGVFYRYDVRAHDVGAHPGVVSPAANGAPRANPPTGLTVGYDYTLIGVALQWSPATGNIYSTSGYIVYRATCSTCTTFSPVAVLPPAATAYVDTAVAVGRLYQYALTTVTDEAGWSEGPRTAVVRILAPPAAPFGLTVTGLPGYSLWLAWSVSSNAPGLVSNYPISRAVPGTTSVFTTVASQAPQSVTIYTDTNLSAGVRYYYRIAAVLNSPPDTAISPPSEIVSHVIEPSTPAGLTGLPDDGIIRLSWIDQRPVQEVDAYLLYRSTGYPAGATMFLASLTTSYYDDTTVTNGLIYQYRIAAVNAGGTSSTTLDTLPMIPYRPPLAPGWLSTSSGLGRATLVWGPAPTTTWPLASYEIWRGTYPGGETLFTSIGFTQNTYLSNPLTNGTTYYFKVRAVDTVFNAGPFSNTAPVTPAIPPCPPAAITAVVTTGQVELSWSLVSGTLCAPNSTFPVSGYTVYRSTYAGGGYTAVFSAVDAFSTAYIDSAVVIGITYYYAVRTFDTVVPPNASVSLTTPFGPAYSPELAATPRIAAGAPQSLTILPGEFSEHDTKLHLAWAPSATGTFQVIGYDVYRSLGAGLPETRVFVSGGAVGSYLDTGLANGIFYYFRVAPVEEIGVTGDWAGIGGTPFADPAAPLSLTVQEGDSQLVLAWTAAVATSFPVTGYRITRATYAGFLDGAGAVVGPDPLYATTYADTTVVNALPYWYRVLTWDSPGHLSHARSPEASGTPYAPPLAPSWLSITALNMSARLDWTPAPATTYPVSAYVVYRATFTGAGSCAPCAIATVWGDTTSVYLAAGLTNGVTVFMAVATRDSLGHVGPAGNQVMTQPAIAPCPPATLTAQSGTVSIAMQWAPVNGAVCASPSTFPVAGYRVWRATAAAAPVVWISDVTGASVSVYTDVTPVPGVTYYYAIRSFDDRVPGNEGSAYSIQVSGTARTPAGPPLALTVQGEPFEHDQMAKLLWSPAVTGTLPVAGYNVYRSSCTGCPEAKIFGPGSAAVVSLLDTGISNTMYWEYRVTTVEQGFFEGGSAIASTTPFADPQPPIALTIRELDAVLTVGWTPVANTSYPVTAYRVSRATWPGTVALLVIADNLYSTTFADTTVTNGLAYFYHLQAYDTQGHLSHDYSAQIGGTPYAAPGAPFTLTYAVPGDNRITVSWSPATAGTWPLGGYAVYRQAGSDPGCGGVPFMTVGAGQLQIIDSTVLNDGTFWYYRIAAFDSVSTGHLGACGGVMSASPYAGIDPPGAPSNLSAVPTPVQVALNWQPAAATTRPVSGYALYRTTFAGNAASVMEWSASIQGSTTSVYVDAAPALGFVYYYRLRTYDMDSATPVTAGPYTSAVSNETGVFVAQPPQTLTALSLSPNQLYVGWAVPSVDPAGLAVNGYRIHRSTGADGPYGLIGSTGTVTSFDDTGVTRGLTSFYRVEAQHQDGWISPWSSTAFGTPAGAPSAPVVSAAADDGLVAVTWLPASGTFPPITYAIFRGTFAGVDPLEPPYATGLTGLTYNDLGVINGIPYYYRMASVDVGSVSAFSISEPFALPLARPMTLTAVPGDSRISLGWGPSPNGLGGVSGYLVYRRTLVTAEGVAGTIFGASATSYLDLAVANGVMYYYRVRAFDSIATPTNYGPYSVEAQARPITPPGPPTIAQIWPSFGAVDLCWTGAAPPGTNPTGGYTVWRSSNGGPMILVATVGTVSCYADGGLQNGVTWGYQVAAFDTAAPPVEGPPSNVVSALPYDIPAPPTTLTTFAASGELLVGWAASVPTTWPVAGYNVYRGTTPDGESPMAVNGSLITATSFLNTGLVNGTRYYFKIRAQDSQGRLSATSAEVSGVPFLPPTSPALSAGPLDRRVDLSWSAPTGTYIPVTGYALYRGTFAGFPAGVPEFVTAAVAYTDLTVTNGTPYYYRIGARDSDWITGPHETLSNEKFVLPLGVPTSLSAVPGDTKASLAWTPSALGLGGIAGYQVWRNAPLAAPVMIATVPGATNTLYVDLTAGNGTTWTYRIAAIDSLFAPINLGTFSATVATTPGIAWSAPVLSSAVPSNQRVDVVWSAPTVAGTSPLTAYRLYRSSAADPFMLWKTLSATVLSVADTPVTNGVTWRYYVTAIDTGMPPIESPASNVRSAVPFEPPLPPGNLTVLVRNGQIYLGWATAYLSGTATVYVQTSYAPNGYHIYRATYPGFGVGSPNVVYVAFASGGGTTSYVDAPAARPGIYPNSPVLPAAPPNSIVNGTPYFYAMRTNDVGGNPSTALSVTAYGTPFAPPAPPGSLSALPMNLGVRLAWSTPFEVSNVSINPSNTVWVGAGWYGPGTFVPGTYRPVSGYMIYRGLAPGAGTLLTGPVFATMYLDATAANGTPYWYTVRARNGRGDEGGWSSEETATPAATIVNPPMVVNSTVGGSSISLSWTLTIAGAPPTDQYVIMRSTCALCLYDTISLGASPYVSSTVFAYTDATVLAGGYYRYAVRSVVLTPYGESVDYPWTVVTIASSCAVPGSPAPVVATAGSGVATITWAASVKGCPADSVTYRLERSDNGGASWTTLAAATSLLMYSDAGLVNGTTYLWRVTPSGTGGIGSAASSPPVTPSTRPNEALLSANAFAPLRGDRMYLTFTLEVRAAPKLKVYTLSGMKVLDLENIEQPAGPSTGTYSLLGPDGLPGWDGQAADGKFVASGVYLVEFSAGTYRKSLKVVVIK